VRELRSGLWHWEAPHPQWRPTEPWSEKVSSCAIDDGERLLLFDPLAVPSELGELAARRETAIVLTAPWHERDARSLVERLGAPVYTPLPDTAQYLMDTYGLTAEQAGDGSPDLVWLREKEGEASTCSRRTAGRPTGPPSSARCPPALPLSSVVRDMRAQGRRGCEMELTDG